MLKSTLQTSANLQNLSVRQEENIIFFNLELKT